MKVEQALGKLFSGLTVAITGNENATVQYGYGDGIELNRWIGKQNNSDNPKYPLLWYVSQKYREDGSFIEVKNASLAIFTNTKLNLFNEQRATETYAGILEPVWRKVEKLLTREQHFEFIGSSSKTKDRYEVDDQPLYGTSMSKLLENQKKGKGVLVDIVDAKFIELDFRINTKCIK